MYLMELVPIRRAEKHGRVNSHTSNSLAIISCIIGGTLVGLFKLVFMGLNKSILSLFKFVFLGIN